MKVKVHASGTRLGDRIVSYGGDQHSAPIVYQFTEGGEAPVVWCFQDGTWDSVDEGAAMITVWRAASSLQAGDVVVVRDFETPVELLTGPDTFGRVQFVHPDTIGSYESHVITTSSMNVIEFVSEKVQA